jgi:hypothetical protein
VAADRFEYAVVDVRANARSIETALNEAAEEGFRFVSVLSADSDGHFVIMERLRESG